MPDDDKKIDALRKLLSEGKSQTAAAKELGISRSSVIRMMKTIKQTATSNNEEITAIHLLKQVENATTLHLSLDDFKTHLIPSKPVFFTKTESILSSKHIINFTQNHGEYWISSELNYRGICELGDRLGTPLMIGGFCFSAWIDWISNDANYFLFELTSMLEAQHIIDYFDKTVVAVGDGSIMNLNVVWDRGNTWNKVLQYMPVRGVKQNHDLQELASPNHPQPALTPIVQRMIMESKEPIHDLVKLWMTKPDIRDFLKAAWTVENEILHGSYKGNYQDNIWDDITPRNVFERFLEDQCGVPKKYVKKMIDLGRYNLKELKIAIEGGFKDPDDLEVALSGGFMNLRTLTKARKLKCLTNDELEDVVNNGWQDGEKMRQALHLGFGPGDQERYGVLNSLNHIDWFNNTAMFKWANSQPISVLKKLKKFPSPRAYEMAKFIGTIDEPMYRTDKLQLEFNKLPSPGEAFPSNQEQQFEQFLRNDCFTGLLDVGSGGIVTILKKKTKKIPTVPEPKKRKE